VRAAESRARPEARSGSLVQVAGGQGALIRPERIRGSIHTEDVVDFTRREREKASEWPIPRAGTREGERESVGNHESDGKSISTRSFRPRASGDQV